MKKKHYVPMIKEFHLGVHYEVYVSGYWPEPSQKQKRGWWSPREFTYMSNLSGLINNVSELGVLMVKLNSLVKPPATSPELADGSIS